MVHWSSPYFTYVTCNMMFFHHCTKGIIIITSRLLSVWFTDSSEDDFGNVFAWSAPAVFSQRSRSLATAIKPDHALMTKGQDISSISDRAVRKIWLLGSRDWCSYKEFTNKCVFFCQHQEHLLSNLTIFIQICIYIKNITWVMRSYSLCSVGR